MLERYSRPSVTAFATIAQRARGRQIPAARPGWPAGLAEVYEAEASPAVILGPPHVQAEAAFRKWRILHKYVRHRPFHPDPAAARAEQWRAVGGWLDENLGDPEVAAWVGEQADIADNLARGIRDMRPRKDGPCHCLLLEYVGNRKRKANAVYRFALAAKEADPDQDWQVSAAMIEAWQKGPAETGEN